MHYKSLAPVDVDGATELFRMKISGSEDDVGIHDG